VRPLVLLRPEPGLSASAARARALGLTVIENPLFAIEPVAWSIPDDSRFDALLLTSANTLRHGGPGLADLSALPVHAVGEVTAEAARAAGFTVRSVGSGGVEELLSSLNGAARLLHLCGGDRIEPNATGHSIERIVVYRSVPIDRPTLTIAGKVVAVHSPRAAQRLAELAADRDRCRIAAISNAAAAACGTGWESVGVADRPDDSSLLALAARLCQTPP
jgi:uroporphyrinogen-III synthase